MFVTRKNYLNVPAHSLIHNVACYPDKFSKRDKIFLLLRLLRREGDVPVLHDQLPGQDREQPGPVCVT